jgi:hypothetical protein
MTTPLIERGSIVDPTTGARGRQLDTSAGRGAGDRPARLERRNRRSFSVLLGSLAARLRSTIPVPAFPSGSHRP